MDSARDVTEAFERIAAADRLRSLRMQRHFATGLLAVVVIIVMAPGVDTLGEFVVIALLCGVTIRSATDGVEARFGHLWEWNYAKPIVPTALDQATERFIELLRPPPRVHAPAASQVRPLDPFAD